MNRQIIIYPAESIIPQQAIPQQTGINLGELMQPLITFMIVMAMMKMMKTMVAPAKPKTPAVMPLPSGYVPVVERPLTRGKEEARRATERAQAQEVKDRRLQLVKEGQRIAAEAGEGVKFVRLDEGWQQKYATIRFWFKDSEGNEIVATDLEELKWKLSR